MKESKDKRIYKELVYIILTIILLVINSSCTYPPHVPCKSDTECNNGYICYDDGWCDGNPCSRKDCGKGECIVDRTTRDYICECDKDSILYENSCIPKCDSFSEECRNFNLFDRDEYSQFHECNMELGRCDHVCLGEASCEEGYRCENDICNKVCKLDSDCESNEICLEESYCIENPCKHKNCGNGICNPHGKFDSIRSKYVICECDENMVLYENAYYREDVCVPKCNGFSEDCKNFNFWPVDFHECNMELGHCDYRCKGEGSCQEGYTCTGENDYSHCIKECNKDNDCVDGEYCNYIENICMRNLCLDEYRNYCGSGGSCTPRGVLDSDYKYSKEGIKNYFHCECDEGYEINNKRCSKTCKDDNDCIGVSHKKRNKCINPYCDNRCDYSDECKDGYYCSYSHDLESSICKKDL